MKYVEGDILTPNSEDKPVLVCHQVNCKGVMGSGLARQIREAFPKVYLAYKRQCDACSISAYNLGMAQICDDSMETHGYSIANLYGQDGYGGGVRRTVYDALRQSLASVAAMCQNYTVRIPYRLGCGLGGGDWDVVTKIIKEELVEAGIDVEIWILNANDWR